MVEVVVTLTDRATVNRPLLKTFPHRAVNGQRASVSSLTNLPVPYRVHPQQTAGSPAPTPALLGAGTRYIPGVV